jgi:folate-binding protein YgfZ
LTQGELLVTASFITQLPNLTVVEVAGEQRHEYLHGQLTVATTSFNQGQARRAAHCDFKGKMFSALTVSDYMDRFLLLSDANAAQETFAQLKKYGVFSKVDITLSETLKVYGGYGTQALETFKVLFESVSNINMAVCSNELGQIITLNDNSLRYLVYLTPAGETLLQDSIDTPISDNPNLWEALEVAAGIANVQQATISEFVPQMLNFQAIDAIDFDKGCYMGQEVVARTKFLGKNKRATFILEGECPQNSAGELPAVGGLVEIQLGENWRRGGSINRVSLVDDKLLLLAVMSNDTEVGSMVRLKDTGITLTVLPLPYTLTD